MLDNTINPTLVPIKMCSAIVEFNQFTPDWTLAQENASEGSRTFVSSVLFDVPFSNVPIVHVGLSGFDIDQRDSARISVHAEAITSNGFDMRIKTWRNTRVYQVEVSWIALGQT
ncbi:H-type lectin domain-containing protein [Kaarinaea lacus]